MNVKSGNAGSLGPCHCTCGGQDCKEFWKGCCLDEGYVEENEDHIIQDDNVENLLVKVLLDPYDGLQEAKQWLH